MDTHFKTPPGNITLVLEGLVGQGWLWSDLWPYLSDMQSPLSVHEQLGRLWRAGLLLQSIQLDDSEIAILLAAGETPLTPTILECQAGLSVSQDVCLHMEGAALVLESLNCGAAIKIFDPAYFAAVTTLLSSSAANNLGDISVLNPDCVQAIRAWLIGAGILERPGGASSRSALQGWSFADRLMHARSRLDHHIGGYGGTFASGNGRPEPPPLASPRDGRRIILEQPDLELITARDQPFTKVLERRSSKRRHSREPIAIGELSEFLYRAARVRSQYQLGGSEYITRPYPSAGGLYELDLYLLVNRCEGVSPSMYRYDGVGHELEHITDPTPVTERMLLDARQSSGFVGEPHILIVLAARFARVNWKYESIAYALVLKNVGVLFQTMYLVSEALGLAACALGGGSSVKFCKAAGTDVWEESSVGEFLLGRAESA